MVGFKVILARRFRGIRGFPLQQIELAEKLSMKDANDRIIYNNATGDLLYDTDGNGAAAAVRFANVGAGLALTNNDFLVV